jgi:hypothetical protein
MLKKLCLVLCLLMAVAALPAPVTANSCPRAVQIAESTPCVQSQIQPLRSSGTYNESRVVTDNGDGTVTVQFIFEPKCLKFNPPCGLATQVVTATVNCAAGTATCP